MNILCFSYQWHPNVLKSQHEMIDLCYKMLTTVCNQSTFEPHTMYIFLITIKEMHRKHPFHNFEKSFSSMQGVFCILSRVKDKFDPIEVTEMLICSIINFFIRFYSSYTIRSCP